MRENHFFIDESRPYKGPYYLVAAVVPVGLLDPSRSSLRKMTREGQRRIHFSSESDRGRKSLVAEMSKLQIRSRVYFCKEKSDVEARRTILKKIVDDMSDLTCSRVVLEAREGQDKRDRIQITNQRNALNLSFSFDHFPAVSEPLLWIPDAVAWCYGNKNKSWKQLVLQSNLVSEVIEVEC